MHDYQRLKYYDYSYFLMVYVMTYEYNILLELQISPKYYSLNKQIIFEISFSIIKRCEAKKSNIIINKKLKRYWVL